MVDDCCSGSLCALGGGTFGGGTGSTPGLGCATVAGTGDIDAQSKQGRLQVITVQYEQLTPRFYKCGILFYRPPIGYMCPAHPLGTLSWLTLWCLDPGGTGILDV